MDSDEKNHGKQGLNVNISLKYFKDISIQVMKIRKYPSYSYPAAEPLTM